MEDRTLGDMIQHDFMGQIGMHTGTFANTLALDRRAKQQAAAREAMCRLALPTPPPPPVFFFNEKQARPPVVDPVKATSGQKKLPRTIPAWKWYAAGCLTGLILPWFF